MAPPDTNLEREKKKHAVPLAVMAAGVAAALIGLFVLVGWVMSEPGSDEAEAEAVSTLRLPAPAVAVL